MGTLVFINEIKKCPMLYNPRIKCTPRSKSNKWEEISKQFGLTVQQAKSRWRTMRDKYILLRKRAHAHPGTECVEQFEDYKFANYLSFLDNLIDFDDNSPSKPQSQRANIPLSKSWDKAHTLILIKQLSSHQLLYDSTHPLYTHKVHRVAAYRKIANVLKRFKPEITPDMVAAKIRTVKTQYGKEKKYLEKFTAKYGRPCRPKLWFYNKLSFFENQYSPKNQKLSEEDSSNARIKFEIEDHDEEDGNVMNVCHYLEDLKETTEDENEDGFNDIDEWLTSKDDTTRPFEEVQINQGKINNFADEDSLQNFETGDIFDPTNEGSFKSAKRNDIYAKCSGLLEILAKQLRPFEKDGSANNSKRCDCENASSSTLLGKMIESELAQVPEHIYIDAKWKIIRILEEAQKKHSAELLE